MTVSYVGLGGNKTRSRYCLTRAVLLLKNLPGIYVKAVSPTYLSAPLGCLGNQKFYYNCVVQLQTSYSPKRVFIYLQQIEKHIQRLRRRRNASRWLDVDYLTHGCARLHGALLDLPHPRMSERAFVLLPLADIVGRQYSKMPNAEKLRQGLRQCHTQLLRRVA